MNAEEIKIRFKDHVPNAMPLCELPVPRILMDYLENHVPFGYGYGGNVGKFAANATNLHHTRSYWCVAESYEIPGQLPELMLRFFATHCTKKHGFEIVEVMRQSPSEQYIYYRNMFYRSLCGWQNVYRDETIKTHGGYYGYNYELWEKGCFNVWIPELPKYQPGITYMFINPEFVNTLEKYRYSGYKRENHFNMISYLRRYNENNGVEFFGKLGIMPTKSLVSKAMKDGNFRRYLRDHAKECAVASSTAVLYAYKKKMPILDAWAEINDKTLAAKKLYGNSTVAKLIPKNIDRRKIFEYADDVGIRNYADYLTAVHELQLDLGDTKVIFPREFKRMHDLRIDEAAAAKAEKDRKEKEKLNKDFETAAVGYGYAAFAPAGDAFAIVMPAKREDLVFEGNALSHCVGRMGYDVRMVKGQSFIAFLRHADDLEKPFVTIEFSLDKNKIVQIYGAHDKRPEKDVLDWSEKWEKYVQKKLREMAKKKAGELAAERMVATA